MWIKTETPGSRHELRTKRAVYLRAHPGIPVTKAIQAAAKSQPLF